MDSAEFAHIRRFLGRSQAQLARLLGISPRAVQSFEEGWRRIPAHAERQLLFLLYMKQSPMIGKEPCWETKKCDPEIREICPAWEFRAGNLCWFVNGTICEGKVQENWKKKMQLCRQCEVFGSLVVSPS